MKVLYKWIPRFAIPISFIWVLWYLIDKFTTVQVVEETTKTLPMVVLIFIVLMVGIIFIGGSVVLFLTYFEQIKKDKLSFITFAPISLLILGLTIISKLMITKVRVLVEINVERFMNDLATYNKTTETLLLILGVGFIIGLGGFVYEKITA